MPAPPAHSILRIEPDPQRCWVPDLSWDTEGGERFHRNLLRKGTGLGIRVRTGGQWKYGVDLPTVASARSGGAQLPDSGNAGKHDPVGYQCLAGPL